MAEEKESAEGAAAGAEESPKKKFSMLTIMLALQCVVILGATGVIAKFVFMAPKPDLSRKALVERAVASIRDDDAQIKFFSLEEFTVNLPDQRSLKAKIDVEISNPLVEEALKARLPVIRAKILQVLSAQNGAMTDRLQGKLLLKDNIKQVLNEAISQMNRDVGGGIVRDVLFVELILL